jgi:hypothetical protein
MASLNQTIDAQKIMRRATMTLTITERRIYRLRKWLAIRLIRLGARLLGCGFKVIDEAEQGPPRPIPKRPRRPRTVRLDRDRLIG